MGKAELPLHAPGTQVDKGYIGQSVPRANAQRLLQGRGAFTDDLRFRLAHVAFFAARTRMRRSRSWISKKRFALPGSSASSTEGRSPSTASLGSRCSRT